MTKQELAQEALARARGSRALTNYPAIFQGFAEKGIAEDDIRPRDNVLTYHAWLAVGRQVRKGEHGVKVLTWIAMDKKVTNPDTGQVDIETTRRPKGSTVFHISQTDAV